MNKIKILNSFPYTTKGNISLTEQNDLSLQAVTATCHSCCLDQLVLTVDVSKRSQLVSAMLKCSTTVTDTAV